MLTELLLGGGSLVPTVMIGLAVFLLAYWVQKNRKYNLPPGPRGLPLIGSALQMDSQRLHEQLFEWSKTYGPVMSVNAGTFSFVVVSDITTALEVLVKRGTDIASRPAVPSGDVFSDDRKDIIMGEFGPTWQLHRKLASKALRQYMVGLELEKRVHKAVNIAFAVMEKEKSPYDSGQYINLIVVNILCGMCFGESYAPDDPELRKLMELKEKLDSLISTFFIEDLFPVLKHFPTPKFRRYQKVVDELVHGLVQGKFDAHRETFDRENIRDFTDYLIQARMEAEEDGDESHLERLTETHLVQTMMDIFTAGIDTSRLTIKFAILHMVKYPEIQAKVQEELDAVLGGRELPCLADRPDMGYTEAVLHESMRMASVAPTGVLHCAVRDTKIKDFDIPQGTAVMINHWALHHDPAGWKDVDSFIPERYLTEEGKLGPKPESWLPFSAGRRVCLGETIAKPELHLIFASLMYRFTWRLPEGGSVDLTPESGLDLLIPKPHQLVIEKRK